MIYGFWMIDMASRYHFFQRPCELRWCYTLFIYYSNTAITYSFSLAPSCFVILTKQSHRRKTTQVSSVETSGGCFGLLNVMGLCFQRYQSPAPEATVVEQTYLLTFAERLHSGTARSFLTAAHHVLASRCLGCIYTKASPRTCDTLTLFPHCSSPPHKIKQKATLRMTLLEDLRLEALLKEKIISQGRAKWAAKHPYHNSITPDVVLNRANTGWEAHMIVYENRLLTGPTMGTPTSSVW
ncbi:hypothetical protein M011DRAFT_150457 [Sporormia fimetaria CBS 119925]|uniref:Uncharacterized protein n=1 Tax=Sporormia fimetaria CBS 119925 TaxID=1340428 RepID=A0A6A6V7K9_9PLEO|nr:hypothetical protein M011DRAFT_150457 [Sporormia fimetaria CBS 119925]